MGWNALRFDPEDVDTSLTMKSEWLFVGLRIDLPKLTTIAAAVGGDGNVTLRLPNHVVLKSR